MRFDGYIQPLGRVNSFLVDPIEEWVRTNLDKAQERPERPFKDGGRQFMCLHVGTGITVSEQIEVVRPAVQAMQSLGGHEDWTAFRIELSIMLPHSKIHQHFDSAFFHTLCDKIHLPIFTNPAVTFYSKMRDADPWEPFKMERGSVYRYNNRVHHAVVNDSNEVRCHMTVDWIKNSDLNRYRADTLMASDRNYGT